MPLQIDQLQPWWQAPFDPELSLGERIMQAGVRHAHRRAVRLTDGSFLDHGYLHEHAEPVRQAIAQALAVHGGAVACLTRTSETLMIAMIASLTTAPSVTFLDDSMPTSWNKDALHRTGARILIADRATVDYARAISGSTDTIILVESPQTHGRQDLIEVPSDGTLTIFTSGSTGRAKGVLRPYAAMAHTAYNLSWRCESVPEDIMLYVGSPAHVGTLNDALLCVLNGFCSIPVQLTDLDVRSITRLVQQLHVNKIAMPPSLMRLFLRHVSMGNPIGRPLMICSSGEALLRSDVRLFFDVLGPESTLWQSYGSTEAGHMIAGYYRPEHAQGSGPLPLNNVARDVEIEVLDQEGKPVSVGETGQVRVRTPALASGYIGEESSQLNGFGSDHRSRYFMTGDRAQLVETGVYRVEGRTDRQINRHGRRVELGEVESIILETPGWGEACAALVGDGPQRQMLMAMVSPIDGSENDTERLRTALRHKLPAFAVPALILSVPKLPRTPSGKVDLGEVQRFLASKLDTLRTHAGEPPQGSTENWVADAWQAVLGSRERPTRDVTFDAFGGDSLNAIDLTLRLGEKFNVQLGIDFVSANRTLASQALALQSMPSGRLQSSRIVPLRSDGNGPIVVLVPGAGGHAWVYLGIADEIKCECEMLALNLQSNSSGDLCIEHLTKTVIDATEPYDPTRPLYFVGYSFGSLIACSLAQACRAQGRKVAGIALIDPRPTHSKSIARKLKDALQSLIRSLRVQNNESDLSRELDRQIQATRTEIAKRYRPEKTQISDGPCSVLFTTETLAMLSTDHRLFNCSLDKLDVQEAKDIQHLDLMQRCGVSLVASWLNGVLNRAKPSPELAQTNS